MKKFQSSSPKIFLKMQFMVISLIQINFPYLAAEFVFAVSFSSRLASVFDMEILWPDNVQRLKWCFSFVLRFD